MSTLHGTVAAEERLRWLADRLTNDGAVTIVDAAAALDVSDMTIRRDLAQLEDLGAARRVRGGATAIGPRPFALRRETAARAKAEVADKLADLLPAEGVVAFDASSTMMRLATRLDHARDLSIVTHGPDTFAALQKLSGVAPLLTGGRLDLRTGSLVGPLACRAAEQISVEVFFASAAALSVRVGAMEATLEEAEVKRSIAAGAGHIVVAVDASKLDKSTMAAALGWDLIDTLVTELDPSDPRLLPYRDFARIL